RCESTCSGSNSASPSHQSWTAPKTAGCCSIRKSKAGPMSSLALLPKVRGKHSAPAPLHRLKQAQDLDSTHPMLRTGVPHAGGGGQDVKRTSTLGHHSVDAVPSHSAG